MSAISGVAGAAHAVTDPVGFLLSAAVGLIAHLVAMAGTEMSSVLDRFLFRTVDPTAPARAITANPAVATLNRSLAIAVDALVGLVILVSALRSIFERSLHARYDLKVVLPRVLLAVVLAHGSLLFAQMAVDLNNALCGIAESLGGPLTGDNLPWAPSTAPVTLAQVVTGNDLFQALLLVGLVVAVVILVLTYVVRTALLNVLLVTAPLAALLNVLPETRGHARTWLRLFTGTLFMQAVQLIVLRVAVATEFDSTGGLVSTIYALATLWLVLKVPGAMSTGLHLESKAHTVLHTLERSARRALLPAHAHAHAPRRAA